MFLWTDRGTPTIASLRGSTPLAAPKRWATEKLQMSQFFISLFCCQGFGPKCGGSVLSSGVSQAEKDEIVRVHNEFRSRLASGRERRGRPGPQPPATDMEQMVSFCLVILTNVARFDREIIIFNRREKCYVIIYLCCLPTSCTF